MYYFEVAVARVHTGKKIFTYSSDNKIEVGSVVKVPFGSRQVWAIVIAIVRKPIFKTKSIEEKLIDKLPLTSVKLLLWMFEYYPEDNGSIAQLFLPATLAKQKTQSTYQPQLGKNVKLPRATNEQQKILKTIKAYKNQRILLHGDTGTGKTRVFVEIAKNILKNQRSVLILTPEIGLTPQLFNDLKNYLPTYIALTHSALTNAKRRAIWQYALKNKKPTVYIGPRSALFLPIHNLGLIVIDEAHDNSYKQQQSPKYQTLNVAGKLANLHSSLLIHSTATPNIEEYEIAKAHNFLILTMSQTAAGKQTSKTHIINLNERKFFTKSPYVANQLIEATKNALLNNEQVIFFLNRRGSARLIQCNQCGWQAICPNCNLPLIYHHDIHIIRCHSCNYRHLVPNQCPECSNLDIVFKVLGTKTLVEHIQKLFPRAKIKRFDADSANNERYYKQIENLKNGKVDIIIGTQLITKGIDLPKLSVVGVINADNSLNLPDYRAEEITFQQLYQVTGRAIRGHKKSQVFIQTSWPDHPVMKALKNRSWSDFYNYELPKRQAFFYPPKIFLAILKITKKTSALAEAKSHVVIKQLSQQKGLDILGPSPSFYAKTSKGYTWQIILKSNRRSKLVKIVKQLPSGWTANIDPSSLL